MRFLFLLFILFPILEMILLIKVGSQIGAVTTVLIVVLTGVVGVSIIKQQGASTLLKVREKLERGTLPATEILETVMLGVAGVSLLFPGFISDAVGILLLFPFIRKGLIAAFFLKLVNSRVNVHTHWQQTRSNSADEGEIIEGEYTTEIKDRISKK